MNAILGLLGQAAVIGMIAYGISTLAHWPFWPVYGLAYGSTWVLSRVVR